MWGLGKLFAACQKCCYFVAVQFYFIFLGVVRLLSIWIFEIFLASIIFNREPR